MFLLGLLYVVFVGVLVAAGGSAVMILGFVVLLTLAQVFLSDKIGLLSIGAKEVTPEEAPGLHAMIERLCIQADLPKPKVAVMDTERAERVRDGPVAEVGHRLRQHRAS